MILTLLSCGLLGGGEPQQSYCEAICDQAVTCASDERAVDGDGLTNACLDATRAVDDSCATAESEGLDAVSAEALTACTDAIAAEIADGECSGFTGSIDELKTGTPATACATQGADAQAVYDAARDATSEGNDELCTRFSDTFCNAAYDCLLEDFGGSIPDEAVTALGNGPVEYCLAAVDGQTQTCIDDSLYVPEESLTDVNATRQAARECLTGFAALTCDELFSGDIPQLCAGSFSSTEDALAFATALAGVADDFLEYVE